MDKKIGKFLIPSGMGKYEEKIIVELEKYVLNLNERDLDAQLHLMKLYSFFEKHNNIDMMSHSLLCSMKYFHQNDFSTTLFLIQKKNLKDKKLKTVIEMGKFLDKSEYEQFWKLRKDVDIKVVDFDKVIVSEIIQVLSHTFQKIKVETLCKCVNMKKDDVLKKEFLNSHGFFKVSDEVVEFEKTKYNTLKDFPMREVGFDDVKNIIKSSFKQ